MSSRFNKVNARSVLQEGRFLSLQTRVIDWLRSIFFSEARRLKQAEAELLRVECREFPSWPVFPVTGSRTLQLT